MAVLRQGLLEAGETGRGMMEVRDRLVQPAAGEIRKQGLECSERLGGGVSLFRRQYDVMAGGPLDEMVAAPAIAVGVDVPGSARTGGYQPEGTTLCVRRAGAFQPGVGMGADALDVRHQFVWTAEDVLVDALEDEPGRAVVGGDLHLERVVDVAASIGDGRSDLTSEGELPGDRDGVISCGGGHRQAQRETG